MIALDLEWTQSSKSELYTEIIQIGAVKFSGFSGKIEDTFNVFIYPKMSNEISKRSNEMLPGCKESLKSTIDFKEAYLSFRRWCKDEEVYIEWGNSDIKVLNNNCDFWGLENLKPKKLLDLQKVFSHTIGLPKQTINLEAAAIYCGVPLTYEFHNALYDSLYTVMVGLVLKTIPNGFWQKPNKKREQRFNQIWKSPMLKACGLSEIPFNKQPLKYIGPYRRFKDVLKSESGRSLKCPICGKEITAKSWLQCSTLKFLSTIKCSEHGKYICQLIIYNIDKVKWKGVVSMPLPKENLIVEMVTAQRNRPKQSPRKGDKKRPKHRVNHK